MADKDDQFFSSFPAIERNRLASILTTRPRTISLSQVSEISSLDLGVRTKPFPHSTPEQQLSLAQEDLHRLLEYAYMVVEENNALKNILQGAVIIYDDDSMRDFCESLIYSGHDIPVLRSLGGRLATPETLITQLSVNNSHTPASTASQDTTHNTLDTNFPSMVLSVPGQGSSPLMIRKVPPVLSGVTENARGENAEPTLTTPDAASSIRKLASLTFTESWRLQQQQHGQNEAPALKEKAERKSESPKGSPKLKRSEPRSIPKTSGFHPIPKDPRFKTLPMTSESAPVQDARRFTLSESLGTPKFYTQDLLPLLVERNTLKERVLRLEDELENAKSSLVTSTSPPASLPRGSRLNLRPVIGPKEHYITDVMVVGYKKQHSNYVYVINTTWSDRYRYEIYRRYGEFFTFQSTLQQLFPLESGKLKSSERILPSLPTIDNVLSILGRTNSESVLKSRLKTINEYCHILLLQLDLHISRSVFVVNFFKPYPGDKQLSRLERPRGQSLTMSVYPQDIPAGSLFEEYIVIVDHRATAENELSVKAGEIVKVIKKEETGWWLVSKTRVHGEDQWEAPNGKDEDEEGEDGKKVVENLVGYIPGSFLKKYEEGALEFQDTVELEEKYLGFVSSAAVRELDQSMKYTAIEDYYTDDPRQICFKKGAPLIVVETSEDAVSSVTMDNHEEGWWLVAHNGKEGWAPASYLQSTSRSALNIAEKTVMTESVGAQNYIAKMAYTAQLDDEVSFPKHARVEVIEKSVTGWWTVRYNGRVGVAPASLLTLVSHYRVPRQFKSPLTADLGHSVSGINQPPPRRELFLSQKAVTRDDMAIKNGPLTEELHESQCFSDSETEFPASKKRKFKFRSRLMTFVRPKSRDESLAKAAKKRHKTVPAKDLLGIRDVISKSNVSKSLTGTENSREQASSAKDESSRAREDLEGNMQAGSSKPSDLEVTTAEQSIAGIAATPPTEESKDSDAETVLTEGGHFTAEGAIDSEPTTNNCRKGPEPTATEERRMDPATEVSTNDESRVEEDQLIGEPGAVCSSTAEDVGLPQAGTSGIEASSDIEQDKVDLGIAQANPSDPEMTGQSPKAVTQRLRCTSSQCTLEPAVANEDP